MSLVERLSVEPGSGTAAWAARIRRPERHAGGLIALVLFWAGVALLAGAGTWLASRLHGSRPGWVTALVPPMVAAACWVPISLAAIALARRFPVGRRADGGAETASGEEPGATGRPPGGSLPVWSSWVVHGAAAVAVSFVLNLGWASILAASGWLDPSSMALSAVASGVRWLHVNAAVYALIVGAVTLAGRVPGRPSATAESRRLEVGSGARSILLDVDEIDWIEGDGDYARIHCDGREHLSGRRLKELEELLRPEGFVRVHRSSIVNAARIHRLRHVSHGDYEAELECGTVVRVSRRRRDELTRVLERRTLG